MNKKRNLVYNRLHAGDRIRNRRKELKISRERISEAMNLSEKYYSDIERGSCGMSLETLVEIAAYLEVSLDYIIRGTQEVEKAEISKESAAILFQLEHCGSEKREMAVKLLNTYLTE